MIRLFQRISNDIFAGKNIEAYVVTIIALLVAILSVIEDVVPLDLQMAAILAALALLVFKSTAPETAQVDLDVILRDRQSYGPFREFIKDATVFWVYGPSAVNVLANMPDIKREILQRGGKLRVLLQDPKETESVRILHSQLDDMSYLLQDDIQRSITILKTLKQRSKNVEYRFLPYNPGYSIVVADPNGRDGRLIIEFFGFESQSINDRMHIEIHRNQTHYWFEFWASQYESMWEAGRIPEASHGG